MPTRVCVPPTAGSRCTREDVFHCKEQKCNLLKHSLGTDRLPQLRSYVLAYPVLLSRHPALSGSISHFCLPSWVSLLLPCCRWLLTRDQERWRSAAPDFPSPRASISIKSGLITSRVHMSTPEASPTWPCLSHIFVTLRSEWREGDDCGWHFWGNHRNEGKDGSHYMPKGRCCLNKCSTATHSNSPPKC